MAMTSDSGRGMTIEERDAFLTSGATFAKIATTMADGWPVMSPVWYDWLAGEQAARADIEWFRSVSILDETPSPG